MKDKKDEVVVRFLRREAPWNAEDVATFTAAAAEKLVRQGAAEYVEPPAKAKKGAH